MAGFNRPTGFNNRSVTGNGGSGNDLTPVYDPLTNANLKTWIEMDYGVTNSSGVSVALNKAPTGTTYDAIQNTSGNRPAYSSSGGQRNKPYCSFNGTSSKLSIRNALAFTGDFTIFFLGAPKRASGSQPLLFGNSAGTSKVQFQTFKGLTIQSDSSSALVWDGTSTQQVGTLDHGLHLYCLKRTGSTIKWYIDKMLVAQNTMTGTFTLDMIGLAQSSTFFVGDFYWLAAYDACLSDSAQADVEDYQCSKYDHAQHLIILGTESTSNCTITGSTDSSTTVAGQLLTTLRANGYTNYVIYVEAVVGSTFSVSGTRATADPSVSGVICGIDKRTYRFADKPIYDVWGAGNDLASGNSNTLSRYTTYINDRNATNKYKVLLGNNLYIAMAAAGDTNAAAGYPAITSWNSYLAANKPANMATVIDIGGQAHLNTGAGINDSTYYYTGENPILHLMTAGNTIVTAQKYAAYAPYLVADAAA